MVVDLGCYLLATDETITLPIIIIFIPSAGLWSVLAICGGGHFAAAIACADTGTDG